MHWTLFVKPGVSLLKFTTADIDSVRELDLKSQIKRPFNEVVVCLKACDTWQVRRPSAKSFSLYKEVVGLSNKNLLERGK